MENNELITEETIPMEEANVQEAEIDTESTPKEEAENEADGKEGTETVEEPSAKEEAMFQIRYMHEDLDIPMAEAKRYAQMGKHYEENIKNTFDSLDYIASLQGKSVKELVQGMVDGVDSARREELIEELGADNPLVDELMEVYKAKNNKAYETAKAERAAREKQAEEEAEKSVTTKLAEQFEDVRKTFPEYDTLEKVPDAVLKKAIKSGNLELELFRYRLSEDKKIEAEKASQQKNKNETTGSVHSAEGEDGFSSAFMKGLWS